MYGINISPFMRGVKEMECLALREIGAGNTIPTRFERKARNTKS
jgi:hypothetical protein